MKKLLLFLWLSVTFAFETDFDYVVVGTNPISMFEAAYQSARGYRVLVVEQASECGGAWKSITVCGIEHVDLGCHEFGNDAGTKQFLEEYAGCTIVSNGPRDYPGKSWGFYPARGCYELTHNLELLMERFGAVLALNTCLESVFIDTNRVIAEVTLNGQRYTTSKIVVTNCSSINFENPGFNAPPFGRTAQFPHLYLLIEDPTPPRFTYLHTNIAGCCRAMNLTQFAGLEGSGKQLISFQLRDVKQFADGEKFLSELKKQKLVDEGAIIIKTDSYLFEQSSLNRTAIQKPNVAPIFDVLNTSHIANIRLYIEKWKSALLPWKQLNNRMSDHRDGKTVDFDGGHRSFSFPLW